MTSIHPDGIVAAEDRDPNLVFVGVPTRVGNVSEPTRQLLALVADGAKLGPYTFIMRRGIGPCPSTVRNALTALAMRSHAGKTLWIDSDMNASEEHVLRILSHEKPIVAAPYLRKELSLLPQWVCNAKQVPVQDDGLQDCYDVGAGFMSIDAVAFIDMACAYFARRYLQEEPHLANAAAWDLWAPMVVEDDWGVTGRWPRRLSEDYGFCWLARRIGFHVWADTKCPVGHVGPVDFLAVRAMVEALQVGR